MKTMLDVLKEVLPEELNIKSVKEYGSKYKIVFEFENEQASAELSKSCMPGTEHALAYDTIKTAMSTIYFNRGDYINCKKWLDRRLKW